MTVPPPSGRPPRSEWEGLWGRGAVGESRFGPDTVNLPRVPGPYVIIGAGQAGLQIAESLRHEKYDGPVILLGAEAHAPYNRPPLSKQWLLERRAPAALAIRGPEAILRRHIELQLAYHGDRRRSGRARGAVR